MDETLHDHITTNTTGGRPICYQSFAEDIDLIGRGNTKLQHLTPKLDERASSYGKKVSTSKSKIMVNSTSKTQANIIMAGEQLQTVDKFKYLGTTLTQECYVQC